MLTQTDVLMLAVLGSSWLVIALLFLAVKAKGDASASWKGAEREIYGQVYGPMEANKFVGVL